MAPSAASFPSAAAVEQHHENFRRCVDDWDSRVSELAYQFQARSQSACELDSWHDVIGVSAEPWGGGNPAAASTAASVVDSAAAAPAAEAAAEAAAGAEGSTRVLHRLLPRLLLFGKSQAIIPASATSSSSAFSSSNAGEAGDSDGGNRENRGEWEDRGEPEGGDGDSGSEESQERGGDEGRSSRGVGGEEEDSGMGGLAETRGEGGTSRSDRTEGDSGEGERDRSEEMPEKCEENDSLGKAEEADWVDGSAVEEEEREEGGKEGIVGAGEEGIVGAREEGAGGVEGEEQQRVARVLVDLQALVLVGKDLTATMEELLVLLVALLGGEEGRGAGWDGGLAGGGLGEGDADEGLQELLRSDWFKSTEYFTPALDALAAGAAVLLVIDSALAANPAVARGIAAYNSGAKRYQRKGGRGSRGQSEEFELSLAELQGLLMMLEAAIGPQGQQGTFFQSWKESVAWAVGPAAPPLSAAARGTKPGKGGRAKASAGRPLLSGRALWRQQQKWLLPLVAHLNAFADSALHAIASHSEQHNTRRHLAGCIALFLSLAPIAALGYEKQLIKATPSLFEAVKLHPLLPLAGPLPLSASLPLLLALHLPPALLAVSPAPFSALEESKGGGKAGAKRAGGKGEVKGGKATAEGKGNGGGSARGVREVCEDVVRGALDLANEDLPRLASAFPPLAASLSAALRLPLSLSLQCESLEEAMGSQVKLVQETLAITCNARHQVQTLLDLHASLRVSLKRRQIVLVAAVLQAIKQVESALAACLPSLSLHLPLYQQHLLRQLNAALLPLQMDQLAKLPRPPPSQAHPPGDAGGGSEGMGRGGDGVGGEVAGQSSSSVAALLASAPLPAGSLFPWSNRAAMDTHKKLLNSIATLTSMLQLTWHQLPSDHLLSFLSTACSLIPPIVAPVPSCQLLLTQLHFSTLLPSLSSSSSSSSPSTTTACYFLSSRPHLLAPALAALYSQPLIQPSSLQYLIDAFLDGARLLLQPCMQERHGKQPKEHTGRRSSSRTVLRGDIYSVESQLEAALVQSFLRPLTRDIIADLHLHAISHSDLHSANPRLNPRKTGVRNLLQYLQLPPIRLLSRQIDIQAHVAQALETSLYNHTAAAPANWKLSEDVRQLAASKYRLLLPPIAIGGGLAFRLHSPPTSPSSTSSPALPFSLLHPPSLAANLPFFVSAFSFDLSTLTFHQRPSSLSSFHEPSLPTLSTCHADSSPAFSSSHGPRSLTLRQLSSLLQSTHAMLFLQHAATSACKLVAGKLSHLSRLFLHDRAHSLLLQSMKQIQQQQQQQLQQQGKQQQESQATGLAGSLGVAGPANIAAAGTSPGGGGGSTPVAAAGRALTMEGVDELKNKLQEISVDPDWRAAKPAPNAKTHHTSAVPTSSSSAATAASAGDRVAGKRIDEKSGKGRGEAERRPWGEVVVEEVRELGVALGFVLAAATAASHSAEHTLSALPSHAAGSPLHRLLLASPLSHQPLLLLSSLSNSLRPATHTQPVPLLHLLVNLFQRELQASPHRPFLTLPAAIPPLSLLLASKKQLAQQRLADAVAGGGRDGRVGERRVGGGSGGSEGGRGWERGGEGEEGAWEAQDDDWMPDDGFTLGVAFLLTVANQRLAFESMDWFSLALHHLSFQRQAMPMNPPSTLTSSSAAASGGGGGGSGGFAGAAGTAGGAMSGKLGGKGADAGEDDEEEEEGEGTGGAVGVTTLWSSWFGATAASADPAASMPELSPELTHQLRQVGSAIS
ncbi:unnamed protein product [Closterium sp. Naga37s-1]|nr:unnamed protein product [Closterium sp. Naga37s-1]